MTQGKETFPIHDTVRWWAVKPRVSSKQTRYPVGLTVIGCFHKHYDPIKAKDPIYCRIWFLVPRSTLCLNFSQKGLNTWSSQALNFMLHVAFKEGVYLKAVLTSLNMAFLPQRQIPLLIKLTDVLQLRAKSLGDFGQVERNIFIKG